MAIDPKVQADLVAAAQAQIAAVDAFNLLRRKWVASLEAGDEVGTSVGKARIVERLPSEDWNPHFKLTTTDHGDFVREALYLVPWTEADEEAAKLDAHRKTICGVVAQADESALTAIEELLKKGTA